MEESGIYLNGELLENVRTVLEIGDCIQLEVSTESFLIQRRNLHGMFELDKTAVIKM